MPLFRACSNPGLKEVFITKCQFHIPGITPIKTMCSIWDPPVDRLHEFWDPLQTIEIPILLSLKHCRTILYLNTLKRTIYYPKYIEPTELYPSLIRYRSIFQHSIKSQQYP